MALERWGAHVCVAVDADNLIRRLRPPREPAHRVNPPRVATTPRPGASSEIVTSIRLPDPDARKGAPVAEVHAQGLPNLLHEFVHVVLAERLDDDHGIDYHAIPFDSSTASGRRVLFEELACCVASCAYLSRPFVRGGTTESQACMSARVDAWFAEQIEIQPVFYGMEDDPSGFWDRVEEIGRVFGHALADVMALAYARCEAALSEVGAPPEVARPPRRLTLHDLLRRQGRKGLA